MGIEDGVLVDMQGRPITSPETRERAARQLRDFMEKYKSRFQDWFTEFGPNVKPPIKYCLREEEWVWLD